MESLNSTVLDLKSISFHELQDDQSQWWFALSYVGRLVGYLVILGLLVIIVTLILKFLEECESSRNTEERSEDRESSPLWPEKTVPTTYGAYEGDLESGDCAASSSVEVYDGKVCIICYDEERNCFFVPCGHCATCSVCAIRISDGDSKTCPVCRRYIGKVKKLFAQEIMKHLFIGATQLEAERVSGRSETRQ